MSTGLQTIINRCSGLVMDRRNVVGIQYTRNEIPRVSLTPTLNPWRFTLDMPSRFRYNEARSLLEQIDHLDRYTPQLITFSDLPQINWIFKYQGTMSQTQINAITVSSFTATTLVLQNLPVVASSRVLFEPNDLIQIGNNPFPFTVVNQVTRGTGSTVSVTTHRPNIISTSVVGNNITVGADCEFYMFCPNMPIYKLIPGAPIYSGTTIVNNAYIEWSDAFQLYEWVATA